MQLWPADSTVPLPAFLLRSSNPAGFLIWCVIGLCAGIYLFIHGFFLLQRRRLILDTPFSKIRSAALGMVEVGGLAVGPYTVAAPITKRPSYYYRTIVWEWKQHGKNKEWVQVAAECVHVPFFLDDNTGRVLVDPRGADLDIHRDFHQEFCDSFFTIKEAAPDNVHSFLARHGIVTSNKIRVEEFCLKPKNSLFILGTLAENPGLEVTPEPIYETVDCTPTGSFTHPFAVVARNSVPASAPTLASKAGDLSPASGVTVQQEVEIVKPAVIRISSDSPATNSIEMTQQQRIAAALLKAGISNPIVSTSQGLEIPPMQVTAGGDALGSRQDGTSSDHNHGFESHPAVALMKGENNKTFLISWRSRQEVARSLRWKCTLMIWVGPILFLLSLYLLLTIRQLL
jgi:hypothetical protein